MDRVKWSALDSADRRILAMGLIVALLVTLVLVGGAVVFGLAVRVFLLVSGMGV